MENLKSSDQVPINNRRVPQETSLRAFVRDPYEDKIDALLAESKVTPAVADIARRARRNGTWNNTSFTGVRNGD